MAGPNLLPVLLLAGGAYFLMRKGEESAVKPDPDKPGPKPNAKVCRRVDWANRPFEFQPKAVGECLEIHDIPASIAGHLQLEDTSDPEWAFAFKYSGDPYGPGATKTWTITFTGRETPRGYWEPMEAQMLARDNNVPGSTLEPVADLFPPD